MKTALHRSSGVALVVTLILLAIITFMTVTFLVLSRSQRENVSRSTEQAKALKMAELASRVGLVEELAPVKAYGNLAAFDVKVSTNYTSPLGYQRLPAVPRPGIDYNPVNVSYAYGNGQPLVGNDFLQNLENLYFSPRAPVYVPTATNRLAYDFRYYLDLNRNGRFETNGWLPEFNDLLQPITAVDSKGNQYIPLKFFVGDPEWVGVLEKPEYHHSATNLFVGRYAYIIIPASKTLDLNYAHNYAKGIYLGANMLANAGDGFMRNQGASTYEINLGAFLADLNTNYYPLAARNPIVNTYWWPTPSRPPFALGYNYWPVYDRNNVLPNGGWAFTHAMGLVRYRYASSQGNLYPVSSIFGAAGVTAFTSDFIDGFASGPVMTNTWWPVPVDGDTLPLSKPTFGWPGSYNPYHFFSHQDLFDTNKTSTGSTAYNLTTVLQSAGAGSNSYNRYMFYKLLAQAGTDTGPGDPENARINVNYVNVDNNGNIVPDLATNFQAWDPTQFFTNTVNRLLSKAGYTFGINNIQLYPTNFYSASVHRLLQLAANIYDATTNRTFGFTNAFPTIFRPLFLTTRTNGTQVFIVGYRELLPSEHLTLVTAPPPMWDLTVSNSVPVNPTDMVKGIPLIIGARKGFPNFNELELRTKIEVTRKLEFIKKRVADKTPSATNQMYLVSITNDFGLEAWNSYTNAYPRGLEMTIAVELTASMSNEFGAMVYSNTVPFSNYTSFGTSRMQIPANSWTGYSAAFPNYSFLTPYTSNNAHFAFLVPASYSSINNRLVTPYQTAFETGEGFPIPQWYLNLKTSMRFILFDVAAGRIVDYVNLQSVNAPFNITTNLSYVAEGIPTGGTLNGYYGNMFLTNRVGGGSSNVFAPTYGIINQIYAGLGMNSNNLVWKSATATVPAGWDTQGTINFFRTNLLQLPPVGAYTGPLYMTNRFYCPYAPTRDLYVYTSWQANDPLVHYTVGDLTPLRYTNACDYDTSVQQNQTIGNIGGVNSRYEPWNYPNGQGNSTMTDMRVKDPLIMQSSDWDFPTNKFANAGWLGRVHRGTPWQTVYLKSAPIDLLTWQRWTGNGQMEYNVGQVTPGMVPLKALYTDAVITHPTNDWRLLDMFTTAFSDSAMRGQLSINQTNLAAWSAVLSGVSVNPDVTSSYIIQPAGTYWPSSPPPVITIYNAINDVRRTNYGGAFKQLGDILSVPELSTNSPFLNPYVNKQAGKPLLTDAVIERIPQQILGLLKGGEQPRFVVYCYGQALKPADHSRVTAGPYLNLCTNYQITAEVTTRAVVRIEGAPGNPRAVLESYSVLPPD